MRSRWSPVAAYAAVSAANQMLWLTYTPITTDAARHYGVSSGAIGWLAEVFPLVYVLLALPTGRLIDQRLAAWLTVGATLTAVGALVRLVSDSFEFVLAGQILVAVAQPLVLNAVLPLVSRSLRPDDRASGIAVSSAGIFGGMLVALVLGAALGGSRIPALAVIQAALAVAAAGWLVVALRARSDLATEVPTAADAESPRAPALRAVWAQPAVRLLIALVCAGFGVFIALTTWLQTLLKPAGVSDSAAGTMLVLMVVAGVLGSAAAPPWLVRHGRELHFVLASVLAGVAGMVVLAIAPGVATGVVVLVVVGALLLTDLPVILELAERQAGAAGGTAGALVWLAGNGAGLVAALIVGALVHVPTAAFLVLAVLLAAGVPLLAALRRRSGPAVRASSSAALGPG